MNKGLLAVLTGCLIGSPVLGQVPTLLPAPEPADVTAPPLQFDDPAAATAPRFYAGAEYLLWWSHGGPSAANLFPSSAFGGPASGWRVQGGFFPVGPRGVGIEAGGLRLEQRSTFFPGR